MNAYVAGHGASVERRQFTVVRFLRSLAGLFVVSVAINAAWSVPARAACQYTVYHPQPTTCSLLPGIKLYAEVFNCEGESTARYTTVACYDCPQGLNPPCQESPGCDDAVCLGQCSTSENCDGSDNDCDGMTDEGCDDSCSDNDAYPTNYATGLMHSSERIDVSLPSADGIPFRLARSYWSGTDEPTYWTAVNALPQQAVSRVSATFMGLGWRHSVEQRVFSTKGSNDSPQKYTWLREGDSISFAKDLDQDATTDPRAYTRFLAEDQLPYELRLYGGIGTPTAIRIVDKDTLVAWEFDFSPTLSLCKRDHICSAQGLCVPDGDGTPDEPGQACDSMARTAYLARIVHYASSTSYSGSLPIDRYWQELVRNADLGVSMVKDAFGARTLRFTYQPQDFAAGRSRARVATVAVCGGASEVNCAPNSPTFTFDYYASLSELPGTSGWQGADAQNLLHSVTASDDSYERYLYTPTDKGWRLTAVIVPRRTGVAAPMSRGVAATSDEYVLEQNTFNTDGTVRESSGPGERFGYSYAGGTTTQVDLNSPAGPSCASSACASGQACWNSVCYRAKALGVSTATAHLTSTAQYCSDCGVPNATFGGSITYHADQRRVSAHADTGQVGVGAPSPTYTSYAYWTGQTGADAFKNGKLKRKVSLDTDTDATTAPSGTVVVEYTYAATTFGGQPATSETVTRPSNLSTTGTPRTTTTTITKDVMGRVREHREVGWTRAANTTAPSQQTRVTTTVYDTYGRPTSVEVTDGASVVFARTLFTYWSNSTDATSGMLRYEDRYSSAASYLRTTYNGYHLLGANTSSVDPSMTVTTTHLVDHRGRVYETLVDGMLLSHKNYNADGSVALSYDNDNICTAYEYDYRGLLVGTRLSSVAMCDDLPILSSDTGGVEVELRTYSSPGRLATLKKYRDGVQHSSVTYGYNDRGLPSSTSVPTSQTYYDPKELVRQSAASSTVTDYALDVFGRRTEEKRALGGALYLKTQFDYLGTDGSLAAGLFLPSTIKTKDSTGGVTTTTGYVYDDFGNTVEFQGPDSGTTRTEYDAGGRMIKRRTAVLTAGERDESRTYDWLGRVLRVNYDSDASHLVTCTAQAGQAILTDEEYYYDACPPAASRPSGFVCAYPEGRMTMARVELHCEGSMSTRAYKRGTWYTYDKRGNVTKEASAYGWGNQGSLTAGSFAGDAFGSVASEDLDYVYSPGDRLKELRNPLTFLRDQRWTLSPNDGRATEVRDTNGTPGGVVVSNVTYRAGGAWDAYATGATLNGVPLYQVRQFNNARNTIERIWTRRGTSGSLVYSGGVDINYARDADDRPTGRTHGSGFTASWRDRFYSYDGAGRLTCEQGTAAGGCPTTGTNLRSNHSYTDYSVVGENRMLGYWNTPEQVGNFYSTYVSGTNRLDAQVNAGWTMVVNYYHDQRGRRTKDDNSSFTGDALHPQGGNDDARTFTYLPNGKLATVQGRRFWNYYNFGTYYHLVYPYTMTFSYDHRGRPVFVTYSETGGSGLALPVSKSWELYWDQSDRLIAAEHIPNVALPATYQIWSYFYLGSERVAAFLIDVTPSMSVDYRVLYLNDQLQVPLSILDTSVTTAPVVRERQDVEAFGWRVRSTSPYWGKWFPFVLPGQLWFDELAVKPFTQSCFAATGSCPVVFARPAVAWHGARTYDSYVGQFMQPDPVDEMIPTAAQPGAYSYVRQAPTTRVDPKGLWHTGLACSLEQRIRIKDAIVKAVREIYECTNECKPGDTVKWIGWILMREYYCVPWVKDTGVATQDSDGLAPCSVRSEWAPCPKGPTFGCASTDPANLSQTHLSARILDDVDDPYCKNATDCLSRVIAHEARHALKPHDKHSDIYKQADECVSCP